MKNLLDIINSKIDVLDSDLEEIMYNEALFTLSKIKKEFKNNSGVELQKYFDKLSEIQNIQKNFISYFSSYNSEKDASNDMNKNSNPNDSISVSAPAIEESPKKEIVDKIKSFANIPENSYYFYSFNNDYAEVGDGLNITYSIKPLKDFKLFSLKISGIKLFDNIFLARTIRESMKKIFKFLFTLNELPFISICEKNTKYFSTSPNQMRSAITLKENKCYFESDIDESEASEMLLSFLNHINIDENACKVLLNASSTKNKEGYITFIL